MAHKRKQPVQIQEVLEQDLHWALEGNLDQAIKTLQSYKKTYSKKYNSIVIDFDYDYGYGYGGEDRSTSCTLIGYRDESKADEAKRIKADRKLQDDLVLREMKQLALLKKKYDK